MKRKERLKKEENHVLDSLIISLINEKKPESVDQLVKLVATKGFSEERIIREIARLEKLRKIRLETGLLEEKGSMSRLFSSLPLWYVGVVVSCLLAIVSVLAIPSNWFPLAYIRWVSGLVLLLFVPGFCTMKSLFLKKEIANMELIIFSVCFSLILILLVGLFWNFTPLGLSDAPIVATLTVISVMLATFAVFKRTQIK